MQLFEQALAAGHLECGVDSQCLVVEHLEPGVDGEHSGPAGQADSLAAAVPAHPPAFAQHAVHAPAQTSAAFSALVLLSPCVLFCPVLLCHTLRLLCTSAVLVMLSLLCR